MAPFLIELLDVKTYGTPIAQPLLERLTTMHIMMDYLIMTDGLPLKDKAREQAIAKLPELHKQDYTFDIDIIAATISQLGQLYQEYCKPFASSKRVKVSENNLQRIIIAAIIGDFLSRAYELYTNSAKTERQSLSTGFTENLNLAREASEFTADTCFDLATYFYSITQFELAAILFDTARERYWNLYIKKPTKDSCNSALNAREKCADAFFQLWKTTQSITAKQSAIGQYGILLEIYAGKQTQQTPYKKTLEEERKTYERLSQLLPDLPIYQTLLFQCPLPQQSPTTMAAMDPEPLLSSQSTGAKTAPQILIRLRLSPAPPLQVTIFRSASKGNGGDTHNSPNSKRKESAAGSPSKEETHYALLAKKFKGFHALPDSGTTVHRTPNP
jgi:hypothetical protein